MLIAVGLLTIEQTWRDNEDWLSGSSVRAFESVVSELEELEREQMSPLGDRWRDA